MPLDPPRLCEAGPCRHYHTMTIQLDAQQPHAERVDGRLVEHGRVFHTEQHHYCYPDVGIETNLGALPVLSCNRWVPITSLLRGRRSIRRGYERELAAFHRAREAEVATFEAPASVRVELVIVLVGHAPLLAKMVTVDSDTAIGTLIEQYPLDLIPPGASRSQTLDGEPLENTSATVGELGLTDGCRLIVTYTPPGAS